MDVTPCSGSIEALQSAEPLKEKLRVALLKKTLEVEKENGEALMEMVSHLGQNLDIRV